MNFVQSEFFSYCHDTKFSSLDSLGLCSNPKHNNWELLQCNSCVLETEDNR